MNRYQRFLLPFLLLIAAVTGSVAKASTNPVRTIPEAQQRPPATFEGRYSYRPACRQLTAAPGGAPGWFAWGPTIEGKHQNWRGVEASVPPEEAYQRLAVVGLCVLDGELVPLSAETVRTVADEDSRLSMAQRNVEQLKAAPDQNSDGEAFAQFVFVGLIAIGGVLLWEKAENTRWMRRLSGADSAFSAAFTYTPPSYQPPSPTPAPQDRIPKRVSRETLSDLPNAPTATRSALDILVASPFVSRAVFGAERTGKTNLVASVMQQLAERGIKIFVINLSCVDVGSEDSTYWDKSNIRSVRGDLETINDRSVAAKLIQDASNLVDTFMQEQAPSILVVDEWSNATASHAEYVDLLAPLIKTLAAKITAFSSTGMKRQKALWTIAPEIVAGTMEDFGKAVKKLSLCLVAIAPGHTVTWHGQELSFSWELYGQCTKNYVGLTPPPEEAKASRLAYLNGQWVPLGTSSLVKTAVVASGTSAEASTLLSLPPVDKAISPELQTFREWLDGKAGTVIDYDTFKNANKLRQLGRSRVNYDLYCDKAVMKGWVIPKGDVGYFVLE